MIKKLLYLNAVLLIFYAAQAQELPCFVENFESITTGHAEGTQGSNSSWDGNDNFPYVESVYRAGQAVRIGTAARSGVMTSKPIPLLSTTIRIVLEIKGWTNIEGFLTVQIGGQVQNIIYDNTLSEGFRSYEVHFSGIDINQNTLSLHQESGRCFIADIKLYCHNTCVLNAELEHFPTSGPLGTQITIAAPDVDISNANLYHNGLLIQPDLIQSNKLQFVVTSTEQQSSYVLQMPNGCLYPFVFNHLQSSVTGCTQESLFSDLIISEVFDATVNNIWYMEFYNPTAEMIYLYNYSVQRFATVGDELPTRVLQFEAQHTVAPKSTFTAQFANFASAETLTCNTPLDWYNNGPGINALDEIRLLKNGQLLDVVHAPDWIGYSIYRNPQFQGPAAVFNPLHWDVFEQERCEDLGAYAELPDVPVLSNQAVPAVDCTTTSLSLVTHIDYPVGFQDTPIFSWFVLDSSWVPINDTIEFDGFDTPELVVYQPLNFINKQFFMTMSFGESCILYSQVFRITSDLTTTWNGVAWSNNLPNMNSIAVIDATYNTQINGALEACILSVTPRGQLYVNSLTTVYVVNQVLNSGVFVIEDHGQLIQHNNEAVNSGAIMYHRKVTTTKEDYVYWASPVASFALNAIWPGASTNTMFAWAPTQISPFGDFGNWIPYHGFMQPGAGYIVKTPVNSLQAVEQQVTFEGKPNNGFIQQIVARGNYTGAPYLNPQSNAFITALSDNFNLLGNPYPSAIDARLFLEENPILQGHIYIWTHQQAPSAAVENPFYGSYLYNYASSDYLIYNGSGSSMGPNTFDGNIGTAQGFFVVLQDGAAVETAVTFNNQMRTSHTQDTKFYRQAAISEQKIWLDLHALDPPYVYSRLLLAFSQNASNAYDKWYDAALNPSENLSFYTFIDNDKYIIQGRKAPWSASDQVALGMQLPKPGNYSISMPHLSEQFQEEPLMVVLEDRLRNTETNLLLDKYDFYAADVVDSRFFLKIKQSNLSIVETSIESSVRIYGISDKWVESKIKKMDKIYIYELTSRLIHQLQVDDHHIKLPHLQRGNYLLQIQFKDTSQIHVKLSK